jgi:cathepsin L
MTAYLLLVLCATAVFAAPKWHELESYTFEHYELDFSKRYTAEERLLRKELFNRKLREIKQHNHDHTKSWKLGVNQLSDRTESELKALRGAIPSGVQKIHPSYRATEKIDLKALEAQDVDWRTKGVVTAVKDQGGCGSCWSFATAEVIESYYAILTGQLSALSEQQILDCTPNPDECGGTGGCGGGTAQLAMARIQELGGLATEWTYPYLSYGGANFKCHYDQSTTPPFANVSNYFTLPSNEYAPLLQHVASKGPVAISVDAGAWSSYEEGVFDGCNQTNPDIDHAVLLVGYGVDAAHGPYWLVRNSWSAAWGEKGYIKVKRTDNEQGRCGMDITPRDGDGCKDGPPEVKVCGTCGILYDNAYPEVSKPTSK